MWQRGRSQKIPPLGCVVEAASTKGERNEFENVLRDQRLVGGGLHSKCACDFKFVL